MIGSILLARLGRRARRADGLRQADGRAPRAAGRRHRLARRLCRLGPASALENLRMSVAICHITKRKFDVVIVGAGGSGMRASLQLSLRRPQRGRAVQGVPHALAHRRGAGRHRRLARQHERGQLALPLLRHRQGLRLARRPGRDRVHVPRSAQGRLRARALRHAVRPQPGRHDLPAPVRRPHRQLRREGRAARLRRGRPHRPRAAAHAVPAERQVAHAVLRRVDGAGPDPRRRRATSSASPPSRWRRATCTSSRPRWCCWPPAARAASTRRRPTPSSTPATAWAWRRAPASRWKTWSSGSSTRPASPAPACC